MRVQGFEWLFVPQDLWVGIYIERGHGSMYWSGGFRVYVMLLPMLGFCFEVYSERIKRLRHERLADGPNH